MHGVPLPPSPSLVTPLALATAVLKLECGRREHEEHHSAIALIASRWRHLTTDACNCFCIGGMVDFCVIANSEKRRGILNTMSRAPRRCGMRNDELRRNGAADRFFAPFRAFLPYVLSTSAKAREGAHMIARFE